jgi:hypothetical protein
VTSPADAEQPPGIDDTDPGWRADLSEWSSYYWNRLHQHEAATWPPPWGPSALAIAGIAALVLIVGGIVMRGAEWVSSTAAVDIVLQPVRRYLDAHAEGLPVNTDTLWWTWCVAGLLLFATSTISRSLAARLGWMLFGAASAAMVYNAAAAPAQPVAAGVTVIWWIVFSFAALRRGSSAQRTTSGTDVGA